MTNSHPANVKSTPKNRVLSSGIDSLVLSLSVLWYDPSLFSYLDKLKEEAKKCGDDFPGNLTYPDSADIWPFSMKPYGTKGFSWILWGCDFTYKICNSISPGTRPSVMVEFRSETLWRLGPEEAVRIALSLIQAQQGEIIKAKLSRVDICVDILLPKTIWSEELRKYAVTRACDIDPHYRLQCFTGMSIGKGQILARIYDKPLEIKQKSKKFWMFDIWGLNEVPEGQKIIRIEFQLRREILRELGLDTVKDLSEKTPGVWAYCSHDWLKFQDRPGRHHTQRSIFNWWEDIQNGFKGVQGAEPLVRVKAVSADKKRLRQQINGLALSLYAINLEEKRADNNQPANVKDFLESHIEEVEKEFPILPDFKDKLAKKRARYSRALPNILAAERCNSFRKLNK